ncbi:hypothetical protein FLK61_26350 [Paenalkalicoccus suaedae]|uniref:DUF4367 domain-containing protein n=1 Tax=Paenalkalicoccus suaedae TaxID=2592382 RepID=A0A859FDF7_9BACI|nr:hypothetical protein [Paenalkalicoccus suaedae]QKS70285.1 hypothetical protein FLK61_26350 [Paenalkalicoccus suaedae]
MKKTNLGVTTLVGAFAITAAYINLTGEENSFTSAPDEPLVASQTHEGDAQIERPQPIALEELNMEVTIPLHLHENEVATDGAESILSQDGVTSSQSNNQESVTAFYMTTEGNEITVVEIQEAITIEEIASWYEEGDVTFFDVEGYDALYDNGHGKVIHITTGEKIYTIGGTKVSDDVLYDIANQIEF